MEESLPPATRAAEALLMGLRLDEGVDLARIARISEVAEEALINTEAVAGLVGLGFVERNGSRLRVLPRGMLLLDALLPEIIAV
jgi:oxygen-independent coproporphyrinogen-3 oxidase